MPKHDAGSGRTETISMKTQITTIVLLILVGLLALYYSKTAYEISGICDDPIETPAAKMLRDLASRGDVDAQYWLGLYLSSGCYEGVKRNIPEAINWYRRAAEQGDTSAQRFLAGSYVLGYGVTLDLKEAYFWSLVGARCGNDNAINDAESLRPRITRYEREEAERRAKSWMPKPTDIRTASSLCPINTSILTKSPI
jgi:TPR repeat protein